MLALRNIFANFWFNASFGFKAPFPKERKSKQILVVLYLNLHRLSYAAMIILVGLKQYIAILNIFVKDMGDVSPYLNIV